MSSEFLMLSFQDTRYMQNKKGNLKTLYNNVSSFILPKKKGKKEKEIKEKRPPEIQAKNHRK